MFDACDSIQGGGLHQVGRVFVRGTSFVFLALCVVQTAEARPQYVDRVPTSFSCETCHLDPANRNLRTGFGIDFGLYRGVWAEEGDPMAGICHLDSDRDGLTNGEELADPGCVWRPGNRRPNGPQTNPADPRDPDRCGDGVQQEGEMCDGEDLGLNDCQSLGYLDGMLACRRDCTLDESLCNPIPEPDMGVMPDPDMGLIQEPDVGEPANDASTASDASSSIDAGAMDAAYVRIEDMNPARMDASVSPSRDDGLDSADARGGQLQPDVEASAVVMPKASKRDDGGCSTTASQRPDVMIFLVLVGLFRLRRTGPKVR